MTGLVHSYILIKKLVLGINIDCHIQYLMQSHHHSNADIGEGKLAFSAKSAIDFTRVVEHRRKYMSKNEATTLRLRRSLSLSEITRPSPSRSRNISPDPKLLAEHQCHPSPMKSPRQSAPVFPGHALDSILSHDSAPGGDKISMQPKSSQRPSSAILPNNWKPVRPPQPQFRPASPNSSQGRPLSPHSDKKLSSSHSNNQTYTNKATPPTPKSPSNFLKVLLPVPHHKSAHANKANVEDPTNSAASPIKVARSPPKEQIKRSDSEPNPTTPSKCCKPIPPPKPWSRPASPNPSQGRPLSPHSDIGLSGAHSNEQICTNEATPPTPKSPSNSVTVLLPVPHHKSAHANKANVEDPTNSSLPSAASPIKVARSPPKQQGKVKRSDSEPSPTTPSKCCKPIPPPKPWSRPASPNPSQGRPLSPSNKQIYTNEATLPTPKSPSNSVGVLLPVPHHHIPTHSTKSDVEDSSTASPQKVARFPPKEQVKVDKHSDSKPEEGSRNEAAPKSFMYLDKSAGDSGDYEVSDIEIGIDKSSCVDLMVEKNTAYGVVEMGLGDESSPVVTALESSYEYVDMRIGNGPIVKRSTTGGPGVYTYLDVVFEKPPTTVVESIAGESGEYEYVEMGIGSENPPSIVEKSIAGESGEYEYVDVGFDKPPSTVKNNVVGKSTVDLQALQQKESIDNKHPALVGLQANEPQKTRDTGKTNQNGG